MTQRTLAGLLAVPLLAVLWFLALQEPLPYVTYTPGMTVNVLGTTEEEGQGEQILQIDGAETYPPDGQLRLTTVLVTQPQSEVNLFELLGAWVDPDSAVYPYDAIYGPDDTNQSQDVEGEFQMASSQDAATAAALSELGMDFEATPVVSNVVADSPAEGEFETGDLLLSVNGTEITTPAEAAEAVDATPEGQPVDFTVLRDGKEKELSVTREEIDGVLRVGIEMREAYDFPIDVDFSVDPDIGGPSAGLMFSIAIYDALTEGSLTDDEIVAGTGTIQPDGAVGPIGGIDQKIAGAREDDAALFLVPAGNCDDAIESPSGDMELVKVSTMSEAVDAVEAWADDRDADLPRCTDETGESGE